MSTTSWPSNITLPVLASGGGGRDEEEEEEAEEKVYTALLYRMSLVFVLFVTR